MAMSFGHVYLLDWMLTYGYLIQKSLHDVVSFRKEVDGIAIDMALQW
jgi:hypothetical protein